MPRGGARVGSGRKPKARNGVVVAAITRFTPTVVDGGKVEESAEESKGESNSLSIPPADLPAEQRDFWHRYAQSAIEQGTLTTHTVAGFRLLCGDSAKLSAWERQIAKDGETYLKITIDGSGQEHQEVKAHPLLAPSIRLSQRVDAGLGRFKITANGKPEAGTGRRKPAANPWASIAGAKR